MQSSIQSSLIAVVALLWSLPAAATDHFIPGKIAIVKDTKLAKIVAKPLTTFSIPAFGNPASDPVLGGGSVQIFDDDGSGTLSDTLTSGTWSGLGNPPGATGYKYKNVLAPAGGAVKVIILKSKVIKILAKDDGVLQPGTMGGDLGVILSTGTTPDRYCASFGGTAVKNDPALFKAKDALPPGICPSSPTCCDGNGFLNFTNVTAPGDCGDVIDANGMLVTNIACGGYYTGGGGNSVPLPVAAADNGSMTLAVTSCTGAVATVGATTSATTGSNEDCTSAGCLFGAPRAVPASIPPLSMCFVAKVSTAPTGAVDCSTGATNISLGIGWDVHLTGDTATDPVSSIPGIQPCPLCSGGTCIGGPNAGFPCTADTTAINSGYPTSNDCPPAPSNLIFTLPLVYGLSSGTVTWTGTPATNDTGSTASSQNRVFSGYCRDVALPGSTGGWDASGAPGSQSKKCWENGMAVGSACSGADNSAESCEQRSNGAFGPNGHLNQTITAIGNSMSILGGPAPATLVSIFSIPPGFDAVIDAVLDLPGPGAVALPGTARSCSNAMSCP